MLNKMGPKMDPFVTLKLILSHSLDKLILETTLTFGKYISKKKRYLQIRIFQNLFTDRVKCLEVRNFLLDRFCLLYKEF